MAITDVKKFVIYSMFVLGLGSIYTLGKNYQK
jgi:hypothetical protein